MWYAVSDIAAFIVKKIAGKMYASKVRVIIKYLVYEHSVIDQVYD